MKSLLTAKSTKSDEEDLKAGLSKKRSKTLLGDEFDDDQKPPEDTRKKLMKFKSAADEDMLN